VSSRGMWCMVQEVVFHACTVGHCIGLLACPAFDLGMNPPLPPLRAQTVASMRTRGRGERRQFDLGMYPPLPPLRAQQLRPCARGAGGSGGKPDRQKE
jgi:hypothetical protein